MEPATADPSLLTDTVTSDTTGSVGTVVSDESDGSVVGSVGTVGFAGLYLVGIVAGVGTVVSAVEVVTGAIGSVELTVVGTVVSDGPELVRSAGDVIVDRLMLLLLTYQSQQE